MTALNEADTIYYGLQVLVVHTPNGLKSDKLFAIRASCVPIEEWTGPMWVEAARIIAAHRSIFVAAHRPDPIQFALIARMVDQPPLTQALLDAREATPRPTEEQLEEVRALAAALKAERKKWKSHFDVELTPDLGFAVLNLSSRIYNLSALPGYCEVDGQAQCWLCSELQDFIISEGLEPAPNVLPAIATELERIDKVAPWALVLEKASTCKDPTKYPEQLVSLLQDMDLKGIAWPTQT